jgi:hypothetical protein
MEECVLDIELVHMPTSEDNQSQHSLNGGMLNDGAKGLIIVHLGGTKSTPKKPMILVSVHRAICLELVLEDALVCHHIGPGG